MINMNLLFIINALGYGGAERACLNIASHMCEKHNVTIATLFDTDYFGYYVDPRITVVNLGFERSTRIRKNPLLFCKYVVTMKRLKKNLDVNCSISFLEESNLLNALSRAGDDVIISVRNFIHLNKKLLNGRKIKSSLASKLANITVAVSKGVAYNLTHNFNVPAEKIRVIYNMYDHYQASANTNEEIMSRFLTYSENSSVKFISTGRLVPQKGQRHLIRAFRNVVAEIPDAKLFIFGRGFLQSYLDSVISANGLEGSVFLMGHDSGIVPYLKLSDIYVCASLGEGFSNSLLEAFANGLPIISSDCDSGPRELLAPNTDILYKTSDIEYADCGILVPVCSNDRSLTTEPLEEGELTLARAMIELAKNTAVRDDYSRKSHERSQDFLPSMIISEWEALLDI